MPRCLLLTVLLATSLLASCSAFRNRESDSQAVERFLRYSGTPIEHFTHFGRFDGWRPLGSDRLVVWTGVNKAYLMTVSRPCPNLQFARSIGVSSSTNAVHRGFDAVTVDGLRCQITEIRPVDYQRMKQDAREERTGGMNIAEPGSRRSGAAA